MAEPSTYPCVVSLGETCTKVPSACRGDSSPVCGSRMFFQYSERFRNRCAFMVSPIAAAKRDSAKSSCVHSIVSDWSSGMYLCWSYEARLPRMRLSTVACFTRSASSALSSTLCAPNAWYSAAIAGAESPSMTPLNEFMKPHCGMAPVWSNACFSEVAMSPVCRGASSAARDASLW